MANLNSNGTVTAGSQDPYVILNQNLASIISQMAMKAPAIRNTLRGGIADATGGAVTAAAQPYNPLASTASNVQNYQGTLDSFAPALGSLKDQYAGFNSGVNDLNASISGLETAYKPQEVSGGSSIVTPGGQNLNTAPVYNPAINPNTLQPFGWTSAPGTVSPGGSGQPHTSVSENNNPLNIKLTATTTKLFEGLGVSLGSTATDGGNFAHFNNPADGLKAARLLLQSSLYANDSVDQALKAWSGNGYDSSILAGTGINPHALIKNLDPVQLDTMMTSMRKAEGGTQNAGVTQTDNALVTSLAPLVANGTSGIGYDQAFKQISDSIPQYGAFIANQLLPAILKINPNFNINQSNALSDSQGINAKAAGTLQPLVDATNGIINGQPAEGGNAAVPSISKLYDNLPPQFQTSSSFSYNASKSIANTFGDSAGQTAVQQWEGAIKELQAKAESVLLQAANLGISTGGQTASSLFPFSVSKAGLTQSIARVQGYENQMISSLKTGSGVKVGPSGNGNDYAAYLKSIGQ